MNSMNGSTGYRGDGNIIPEGYDQGQLQNFTPQTKKLFKSLHKHLRPNSYLSRLSRGDQSQFDEMEAPALRQFNELQGGIASRFSGGGGGPGALSSRKSSGFQNTMSAASSNFAQELQSKRQELQRQAIGDLFGLSNTLFSQKPYENFLQPKQEEESSGWGGLVGAGVGGTAGFFAGGPMGALKGAAVGYNVGSGF